MNDARRVLPMLACAAVLILCPGRVGAACVVTADALQFGALPQFAAQTSARTGTAAVTITCSRLATATTYAIGIGPGPGGGSLGAREMANDRGGPALAYQLYVDPGFSQAWGDGHTGQRITGVMPATTGVSVSRTHPVYARLAPHQPPLRAGSYSDRLNLIVSYSP